MSGSVAGQAGRAAGQAGKAAGQTAGQAAAPAGRAAAITGRGVEVGYGGEAVVRGVDFSVPEGQVTALIGPNGCGKSTLLKALGRQLPLAGGEVEVRGEDLGARGRREYAREVSFLPQHPVAPEGVTVRELIGYGRYPYTGPLAAMRAADHEAVERAAAETGTTQLLGAQAAELSGGQRQRVFIAMTLAQDTPLILLDEPTTYLDPAHQLAILDLVTRLNAMGKTIVMVLHDMVQAARYADTVIAMRDGAVVAQGDTGEVVTPELVADIFGVRCIGVKDPATGRMLPVPYCPLASVGKQTPQ